MNAQDSNVEHLCLALRLWDRHFSEVICEPSCEPACYNSCYSNLRAIATASSSEDCSLLPGDNVVPSSPSANDDDMSTSSFEVDLSVAETFQSLHSLPIAGIAPFSSSLAFLFISKTLSSSSSLSTSRTSSSSLNSITAPAITSVSAIKPTFDNCYAEYLLFEVERENSIVLLASDEEFHLRSSNETQAGQALFFAIHSSLHDVPLPTFVDVAIENNSIDALLSQLICIEMYVFLLSFINPAY